MNAHLKNAGERLRTLIALAAISFLSSSCIEISEEFWINDDNTFRVKFELGINNQMAAMGKASEGGTPFDEAREKLDNDPNVASYELKEETRGEMTFYILDVTAKDVETLSKTLNDSMDGDSPGGEIGLTKLDNGNFKFVQPLDFKSPNAEDENNPLAAGMMAAMFKDRHMTIRVHGNIVSANGEIAEDGQSVEWKFALADAFAGNISMEQVEAEISTGVLGGLGGNKLWILIGIAAVVLLVLIVLALSRKK